MGGRGQQLIMIDIERETFPDYRKSSNLFQPIPSHLQVQKHFTK
jgi:hypothetical protein